MATFSIRERTELDLGAAWAWDDWIMILGDVEFHDYLVANSLQWRGFYGMGIYVQFGLDDGDKMGLRLPLGICYRFPHTRIEALTELAPALQLIPETRPGFHWGVGARIWL